MKLCRHIERKYVMFLVDAVGAINMFLKDCSVQTYSSETPTLLGKQGAVKEQQDMMFGKQGLPSCP